MPDSTTPAAAADSAAAPEQRLEQLVANGHARALYRLPASDTTAATDPACNGPGRFAVHYVLGKTIVVTMKEGVVDQMEVTGQVAGEHLEPPPCRAAPPAAEPSGAAPGGASGAPMAPLPGAPPPSPPPGQRERPSNPRELQPAPDPR